MRWVVELPAPDGGTAATVTVEADSWAGALTNARGGVSIKKFRCEFEDEGVVRVNDLDTRQRYTVRPYRAAAPSAAPAPTPAPAPAPAPVPAPADAKPSEPAKSVRPPSFSVPPPPGSIVSTQRPAAPEAKPEVDAAKTTSTSSIAPSAPAPPADAKAETPTPADAPKVEAPAPEAAAKADAPAAEAPAEVSSAPSEGDRASRLTPSPEETSVPPSEPLPVPTVLFERDQDPSPTNPLTYRERVFSVPEGTRVDLAEQLARQALSAIKRSLVTRPRGRYVTVAVFDHAFSARPERPALVVLRWKDWKGDAPEVEHSPPLPPPASARPSQPAVNGSSVHPPPAAVELTPAPEAPPPAVTVEPAKTEASSEPEPVKVEAAPEPAPEPAKAEAEPEAVKVEVSEAPAVTAAPEPVTVEAPTAEPAAADAPAPSVVVEPVVAPQTEESVVVAPEASTPDAASAAADASDADDAAEEEPAARSDGGKKKKRKRRDTRRTGKQPVVEVAAKAATETSAAPETAKAASETSAAPETAKPATETPAAPVEAKPAEPDKPAATQRSRAATGGVRKRGRDLLSDLFDALMDLSMLHDSEQACAFVATTLHEHLAADAVAVATYDINRDEFVFVAEKDAKDATGRRVRATLGSFGAMLRRRGPVAVGVSEGLDVATGEVGGGPSMVAPGYAHERLFAVVHLGRSAGAPGFESDEQDAALYVASQLGEFLSTHSRREAVKELASDDGPRRR